MDSALLAKVLSDWQPFSSAVAAASATLTGLLFVSLSINRDKLKEAENRVFLRLAKRSFGDYLFVLAVSLLMLVPKQDRSIFPVVLALLGIGRMMRTVREWRHPDYRHVTERTKRETVAEYAAPAISCLGMCVVGGYIYFGRYAAIYGIVFILLELITTASRNSWRLLLLEKKA